MKSVLVVIDTEQKRCDRCDTNLTGSLYKNQKIALQHHKKYLCVKCMTHISRNYGQKITEKELEDFYNNLILRSEI